MFRLTAADIASGTGGTLTQGSGATVFSTVSIDTRTLAPESLFFAIRGPKQDGHRFIPDAFSKGALGAVVEPDYVYPGECPKHRILIRVQDTHAALKSLAGTVRRAWPGTLVAVTGSMGKTTTREFAVQLLQSRFRVYQTPGNYNNLFGLPLALLGLSPEHQVGLFEMGMSAAGEIAEMCRIALPTIGILTNVAPVHLEYFASIEKIADAKGELARGLPENGTLIYNADDAHLRRIAAQYSGSTLSFGQSDCADVRADHIELLDLQSTRFRLSCAGQRLKVQLPFAGAHYVMNTLPGIALCRHFGIAPSEIAEILSTLRPVAMRGRILKFHHGFTVIDDSYNSNPQALMKMIEVLSGTPSFSRRILVAGEMLELGPDAARLHAECGAFAASRGIDRVIGIQGAAHALVHAARDAGVGDSQAQFFADADAAADYVAGMVQPNDLILIKGSRGVHTEKIIHNLCAHFEVTDV